MTQVESSTVTFESDVSRVAGGPFDLAQQRGLGVLERGSEKPLKGGSLVQSGSAALRLILEQATAPGDRVLVPEYICEAVENTVVHAGRVPVTYRVSRRLEPLLSDVVEQMTLDVAAMVLPRYFGLPSRMLDDVSRTCSSRGVVLVEDLVGVADLFQSPGIEIVGSYAFNSLRKFLPVPDGAEVLGVRSLGSLGGEASDSTTTTDRVRAMEMLSEGRRSGDGSPLERQALEALFESESRLVREQSPRLASHFTQAAIRSWDLSTMPLRRRENYSLLNDRSRDAGLAGGRVVPLWPGIDAPHSPLTFPVLVRDGRDALRARLAEERIFCPVHWPVKPSRLGSLSHDARTVAESILSIPIDQRLSIEDVTWIADRIDALG